MTLPLDWESRYVSLDMVESREPDWVIPGVLPIGLSLYVAPSGRYKTTAAVETAACVSVGRAMFGRHAAKHGITLYFAGEQSPATLKMKASPSGWWGTPEAGVTPVRVLLPTDPWEWALDDPRDMDRLLVDIKEFDAQLVVVDPYANFFFNSDENDPKTAKRIGRPLYRIAHERGIGVIIVHHTRKLDENRDLTWDDVRGSSALLSMADGAFLFQAPNEFGVIRIDTKYRDHAAGSLLWTPSTVNARIDTAFLDSVYELVGDGTSVQEIREVLNVRTVKIVEALNALERLGRIVKDGRTWVQRTGALQAAAVSPQS